MIYLKYLKYVTLHKFYVMIECFKRGLYVQGILHDISKLHPDEFNAYAKYTAVFFNNDIDKDTIDENTKNEIKSNFDMAWFHHKRYNKHHWQYWATPESGNTLKAMPIPRKYLEEMVCDWIGANRVGNNSQPNWPSKFYDKVKYEFILHSDTRAILEEIIKEYD
ncbi:MAG: hypothetical protein KAS32_31130 [Candidatus Peribacteraceae bacterium]|nr:hypothetical protein [Candidatus Peribacteraceae bacterium]